MKILILSSVLIIISCASFNGATGPTGPPGKDGKQGPIGPKGEQSKSVREDRLDCLEKCTRTNYGQGQSIFRFKR